MVNLYYAARMKEYNKSRGCLQRNIIVMGRRYSAGDSTEGQMFVPSAFEIISKDEYDELSKKDVIGRPEYRQPRSETTPVFDLFKVNDPKKLIDIAQREADRRAATGASAARAMIDGAVMAQILANEPMPELEVARRVNNGPTPPPSNEPIEPIDDTVNQDGEDNPLLGDLTSIEGEELEEGVGAGTEKAEEEPEPESKKKWAPRPGSKSKAKKTGRGAKK